MRSRRAAHLFLATTLLACGANSAVDLVSDAGTEGASPAFVSEASPPKRQTVRIGGFDGHKARVLEIGPRMHDEW
jgi:hypothetical protein